MAALVSLVGMSGCLDQGVDELVDPFAPLAILEVDREARFTGEAFTFDARASSDPNGNITTYIFDFGDGNTIEVSAEEEARVKHQYEVGGVFDVTLTVVDDGVEQPEALNATKALTVIVDEKRDVGPVIVAAAPDSQSQAARVTHTFNATETAARLELDLTFENQALVASSRVHVRVVDPEGNTLVEETVTIDPDQTQELALEEQITTAGEHTLEIVAESGASDATGELRVFHAALEEPVA